MCNKIIENTERLKYAKAGVDATKKNANEVATEINESQRKTELFDLDIFTNLIRSKLVNAFKTTIKDHYNKTINFYEYPNILRYSVGGYYKLHSDAEYWDNNNKIWNRVNQRELSFLIYLNDDFVGGELSFPNFDFLYKPKKGSFVCFPSDHRFMHKALESKTGTKYAIVTWAMIKDSKFDIELPPINLDKLIKV